MPADLSQVLPYQQEGVRFLSRQPYVMLGDDTGLGKTLQCILAAEALRYRRVLVICPLIGLTSWRVELQKWMVNFRRFEPFTKKLVALPGGPLVHIVPYSALSVPRLKERAIGLVRSAAPFDVVILDEAHYLSSWNSARTVAVYGKWCSYAGGIIDAARPKSVWLLSGTIQRRDARDLYPHLKALFPEAINFALGRPPDAAVRKRDYDEEFLIFSEDRFGRHPVGNDNATIPRLRAAMKPFVLARRKRDVAPELGQVRHYDLPLPLDPEDPYAPAVKHPEFGKALMEELWASPDLHHALALTETAAEERRILGMIKVRPVTAWALDWFAQQEETGKLVLFAWHRDVVRELEERLREFGPVIIMGGTPIHERDTAVDRFQNDPDCRVFVGQTIAAGVAVTLTASSTVVILEPDWLPHNDYQAVSRVHRLGQHEPVICYRAFADGTIDSRIISRANDRRHDFEQLMSGLVTTAPN